MNKKILVKSLDDIKEIIAGDQCYLREIFHPDRDNTHIDFSLAHAYIHPGGHTVDHFLLESETYYILAGEGLMHIDSETFELSAGSSFIVPPESHQWIENQGKTKLEFLVIVNPPWKKEHEFV